MREYKFRGLSVEELVGDDQWLTGFGVDFCEMVDGSVEAYLYTIHGAYKVHPETVSQYIGIKDMHGKELYGGDIVEIKCECAPGDYAVCTHEPWRGYVDWIEDESRFDFRDVDGYRSCEYISSDNSSVWEVIGSIYIHKHLLNLTKEEL